MERENFSGPIVFGIPTYNEADSIGIVAKTIDEGLSKYFKNRKSVIINADNDSPDGTKNVFLNTPTRQEKIYISLGGKSGKGRAIKAVYEYAKENKAIAVGFVDGDVKSAKPEWVKNLIEPVLSGYDHVLPVYLRNEYDGSITNHLVFPILYGLLKADIRQPLGGEIGVSPKAFNLFLSKKWHPNAYQFGVDIFSLTLCFLK